MGREGRANLGVGKEGAMHTESIEHEQCLRRLVDDDSYFLPSVKKIIFKVL